jgi:Flp pilus assembly pilin Flp
MNKNKKSGQTMVEYIIIVVIIAIAAIAIFGIFGDTIRKKLGGAVAELGGDTTAAKEAVGETGDSQKWLKELGSGDAGTGTGD